MKFYILQIFSGSITDASCSLPFSSIEERRYWAEHWWTKEAKYGKDGDLGFILDLIDGKIKLKAIQDCLLDYKWTS